MSDKLKVRKKDIDNAVNRVMDIAFDTDDSRLLLGKSLPKYGYRVKLYRKVAWDLLLMAAQMEAERSFDG